MSLRTLTQDNLDYIGEQKSYFGTPLKKGDSVHFCLLRKKPKYKKSKREIVLDTNFLSIGKLKEYIEEFFNFESLTIIDVTLIMVTDSELKNLTMISNVDKGFPIVELK